MSSYRQTLEDASPVQSLGTIGSGEALSVPSAPLQKASEVIPPAMPTDTFTPLPGQTQRRPCCNDKKGGTVVNVNVNAGNNNGNANGNANGGPGGSAPSQSRPGTYVDTPNGFDVPVQTRIERVEVPVERIVEKPVYKPMVVVREIIRKIKEYVPIKQVYERRVGKEYDDRPMTFEGSATRTTTQTASAPAAPAVPISAGIMPGDQPEYDNATMSMTLPKP